MTQPRTVIVSLASPDRFARIRRQHDALLGFHGERFDAGTLAHVVSVFPSQRSGRDDGVGHAGRTATDRAAADLPPSIVLPPTVDTIRVESPMGRAPLAAARNASARRAADLEATLIVFLDADCVPGPRLLPRYEAAAVPDRLLLGPVTYLTEEETAALDDAVSIAPHPHPARPDPDDGEVIDIAPDASTDPQDPFALFWSLSFACRPELYARLGGFHEAYAGYGAEDTDFGFTARRHGIGLRWVGGAHAFHQFHPVSSPPLEHVADIVANAHVFHSRWGRWPMESWLEQFRAAGLVTYDADAGWQVVPVDV